MTLAQSLSLQLDYIYFAYGLALIYLGGVCFAIHGRQDRKLAWAHFGSGAFVAAAGALLWLFSPRLPNPLLVYARTASQLVALFLFLEFNRKSYKGLTGHKLVPGWVTLAAAAAVLFSAFGGPRAFQLTAAYVLGIPVLFATIAIWVFAFRVERHYEYLIAAAMLLVFVFSSFTLPKAGSIIVWNGSVPAPLLKAIAIFVMASAMWRLAGKFYLADLAQYGQSATKRSPKLVWLSAVLLSIALTGWWATEEAGNRQHDSFKGRIAGLSKTIAAGAPFHRLSMITRSSTPTMPTHEYKDVLNAARAMANASGPVQHVYILQKRAAEITYVVAAKASDALSDSPLPRAGTVVSNPPATLEALFEKPGTLVISPSDFPHHPNPPNTAPGLMHAYSSVIDLHTGQIIGVSGIDISSDELQSSVTQARLTPILATLLLASLLIMFVIAVHRFQLAAARIMVSENRFRDIAMSTADVIWEVNPWTLKVTYCSDNIYQLLGIRAQDYIGKTVMSIMSPKGAAQFEFAANGLREAAKPFTDIEFAALAVGGKEVILNVTGVPVFDADNKLLVYRGTAKNITERKQTDQALKTTNSLYKATIEATGDGILVVDGARNVVQYNARLLEMWNISEQVMKSDTYDGVIEDHVVEKVKNDVAYRMQVNQTNDLQAPANYFIVELKDGRTFERFSVPQILEGRGIARVIIFRDITARRRMEREKDEMQKRIFLSQKLASIGELAAGVAHEINNPLAIVKGYITVVQDELRRRGADPKFITILDKQDSAVDRIANIVNGLRTYARSDTEYVDNVNIHRVIGDTLSLIDHIYRKAGISLRPALDSKNPLVKGNIGKIQQVLMNLLSNAKDALDSSNVPQKIIHLETKDSGDKLVLIVSDTGTGIPQSTLDRIFDAFFTTKPPGKGTGLGLAITHSIVTSMGGKIEAKSRVGHGSSFIITLPQAVGEETVLSAFGSDEAIEPMSGKALVVDDEEEIRTILAEYLAGIGLQVDLAQDGLEGLEKVRQVAYDFIVTDLRMPRMDGETLIVESRKLPHLSKTAIIVITGGIITEYTKEQRSIVRTQADGYLKKPFSKSEICRVLKSTRRSASIPPT